MVWFVLSFIVSLGLMKKHHVPISFLMYAAFLNTFMAYCDSTAATNQGVDLSQLHILELSLYLLLP